jgi:hypothetical protein
MVDRNRPNQAVARSQKPTIAKRMQMLKAYTHVEASEKAKLA